MNKNNEINHNSRYTPQKWKEYLDSIEERKKTDRNIRDDFINNMRNYYNKYADMLDVWYDMYKEAISEKFLTQHYALLDDDNLERVLSRCKILILTANPIEKAIFHHMIVDKENEKIRRIIKGNIEMI